MTTQHEQGSGPSPGAAAAHAYGCHTAAQGQTAGQTADAGAVDSHATQRRALKTSSPAHKPSASAGVRVGRIVVHRSLSILVTVCLLAPHALAGGGKGQKNYKQGLVYEASQQWERAAEEFALAVAAEPGNVEYQLHYRRAIFNASQSLTQKGRELAERGDYVGAYNAFRRAYSYDPVNELALSMMERMQRLQVARGAGGDNRRGDVDADENGLRNVQISPTRYEPVRGGRPATRQNSDAEALPSTRAETHQLITYSGDLGAFIRYLGKQIKLNTVFDRDFPQRTIQVDLEEVTPAQALDYIFLSQGLFYQKLNRRTILIADHSKRPQYLQLVLRTFYLSNVDPNDAKTLIQSAIPPQAGRQPVITPNKATNSLTVRDTPENVRLIGDIIRSIDKERAEVVMDVNIYEVSRSELMQFGNQLGSDVGLTNLGGIQKGLAVFGGSRNVVTQGLGAVAAPTALGAALILPATQLQMLQRRSQTRLIASTQVHAFEGEKSTAHIGQRVPVQTAAVTTFGSNAGNGDGGTQAGVTTGLFGSSGYPVIQYEKTGLTLEFTPQVFPNLDVQVKMSIKSNDVTSTQGGPALTPTFTERNIEGTARIQNNRTMMIASVAQNQQSRGRQGLPILGLLPVLGRLFTAPRDSDQQTDIVIAVTPRVMRAPTITPSDEEVHPSGTLQTPTSNTLEAMLLEDEREEQLVAARMLPKDAHVEVHYAESPNFIPAPRGLASRQVTEPAPLQGDANVETRQAYAVAGATPAPPGDPGRVEVSEAKEGVTRPRSVFATANTPAASAKASPARHEQAAHPFAVAEQILPSSNMTSSAGAHKAQSDGLGGSPKPAKSFGEMSNKEAFAATAAATSGAARPPRSAAELRLSTERHNMRVGERRSLRILLKTDAPLGLVAGTLRFDPRVIAVRSIKSFNHFGGSQALPAVSTEDVPGGGLRFSVMPDYNAPALTGAGVLVSIEVEALVAGESTVSLDDQSMLLLATDGRELLLRLVPCRLTVQ